MNDLWRLFLSQNLDLIYLDNQLKMFKEILYRDKQVM